MSLSWHPELPSPVLLSCISYTKTFSLPTNASTICFRFEYHLHSAARVLSVHWEYSDLLKSVHEV